jgi:hypothetical protein
VPQAEYLITTSGVKRKVFNTTEQKASNKPNDDEDKVESDVKGDISKLLVKDIVRAL